MNLRELKKMIAEEYNAFKKIQKNKAKRFRKHAARRLSEQAPPMGAGPAGMSGPPAGPGAPKLPTINVSDVDVDTEGGGNAEETLQKIMDMLTSYFDGGGADTDDSAPEMDDAADADDAEDVDDAEDEDEDEDEDDKEVNEGTGCYNLKGKRLPESKCYNAKGQLKEGLVLGKKAKVLQERFKKLANIIK